MSPLSENPKHIRYLCQRLSLGVASSAIEQIYGGFHHTMWRLNTDLGSFAIKQLSADTDINNPAVINHYNASEAAAEAFSQQGVKAIFALKNGQHYLHVMDQIAYLVYPWSKAKALKGAISRHHGLLVARLLATMHQANIDVPNMQTQSFDPVLATELLTTLEKAKAVNAPTLPLLLQHKNDFLHIIKAQQAAVPVLKKHLLISHGDLDQKNVLWNADDEPVIIDWESAHRLNPTREMLLAALDWSGISSDFNAALFQAMLLAYKQAGGHIDNEALPAAFDFILGDWLNWLIYNVARSIDELTPELQTTAKDQINFILATMDNLQQLRPELMAMAGLDLH